MRLASNSYAYSYGYFYNLMFSLPCQHLLDPNLNRFSEETVTCSQAGLRTHEPALCAGSTIAGPFTHC